MMPCPPLRPDPALVGHREGDERAIRRARRRLANLAAAAPKVVDRAELGPLPLGDEVASTLREALLFFLDLNDHLDDQAIY